MNADERRSKIDQITEKVIGCAYRVSNTLGAGFLEKVYHNALVIELKEAGLAVSSEHAINVLYRGQIVGEYFADILVEELVIVELKAVSALDEVHQAQCLNYLKATGLAVCLLINFAKPKVEVKRIVRNF
jgi:GxxExxY protein